MVPERPRYSNYDFMYHIHYIYIYTLFLLYQETHISPKTLVAKWTVTEICCMVETDQTIRAAGTGQCRQETGRLTLVTLALIVR